MASELEELVGFITDPNPQVRVVALEHLVPYSTTEPAIFKTEDLKPIKNLKLLVRDLPRIAGHVLNILINLSGEPSILEALATDEKFLDTVLSHITHPEEPNADLLAMLLANMTKWESTKSIFDKKQSAPAELGSDDRVLNQLMDLFVKGQDNGYNKNADFDYLAYVFADLCKHTEIRRHFITLQEYDGVIPLSKLKVFTEHKSDTRRRGVASTIKNVAFEVSSHASLLSSEELDILPYILLPIIGGEEYDADESMDMLPDLQLLPPDKRRDPDAKIIQTHVETLTLLTTTREGRDLMRQVQVYPVIRETHARVEDEDVREACDRLVQVIMRDEAEDEGGRVKEIEDDEDEALVEV